MSLFQLNNLSSHDSFILVSTEKLANITQTHLCVSPGSDFDVTFIRHKDIVYTIRILRLSNKLSSEVCIRITLIFQKSKIDDSNENAINVILYPQSLVQLHFKLILLSSFSIHYLFFTIKLHSRENLHFVFLFVKIVPNLFECLLLTLLFF